MKKDIAYFHLPGLFEFYEFYKEFLKIFYNHREYFYDWCEIGSIYGAPADCIWGGGRVGFGDNNADEVIQLMKKYGISARLTFSNSLLEHKHLRDEKCNKLCKMFELKSPIEASKLCCESQKYSGQVNKDNRNGIIIYSDILIEYIKKNYPDYYFVSSTTKVITEFDKFVEELNREEFEYVVPDFRLNNKLDKLSKLAQRQKDKVEFLCNECCWFECFDRKKCYESVSHMALGEDYPEHRCVAPDLGDGYVFSKAMKNPGFIGIKDIKEVYLPMGFSNFKIEGRSLGSAMILEFLLYYMTKPEYQLVVREQLYLDNSLDLW